ncbi:heat shock 70 kDa protein 12B-like [Saccostrea cucullata]|uniref:heat shock 70 kDa protein 12B-like n=1 Tax=Saccostrea cuccullata TaxID=36930 RepID=UPI002ED2BBED
MDVSIRSKSQSLFVAAIDFGTTYSGYAFSLTQDWKKPYTYHWQGGGLVSHKAPTALLLDSSQNFVAFGYDAEDQYSQLTAKKQQDQYYFFLRFKMILHKDPGVNKNILCEDESGKSLPAIKVFNHCIRYLKDHLYKEIKKSVPGTEEDAIEYVLTVPAIWGDRAKRFMREAATKAGIEKRLIIALEPEAASIYCQHLTNDEEQLSATLGVLNSGQKYMVADLGGGTADITVHKKCEDHTLEEISPASGGPWGGKSVDDRFIRFLEDISGDGTMSKYKKQSLEDYLDVLRTFEVTKRSVSPEKTGKIQVRIPLSFVEFCKESRKVKDFPSAIERSPHKDNVKYVTGKLKWDVNFFKKTFFQKTIESIVKHVDELFEEENVRDVRNILMVGGFSECKLVQKAIMDNFPNKKVIVPTEAGLAVVKGAVYFGHVPDAISRRVARFTYGIQTWPEFKPTIHPQSKKFEVSGMNRCKDVFFPFVQKGQQIPLGFSKSQIFRPLHDDDTRLECAVYISSEKDPKFVDDPGCELLGTLQVPVSRKTPESPRSEVEETLFFGETELRVTARDIMTNQSKDVTFDIF